LNKLARPIQAAGSRLRGTRVLFDHRA